MFNIAVVNKSTTLTDTEVAAAVPALDRQMRHDFYLKWGIVCSVHFYPKGKNPPKPYWKAYILDESDLSGALGYHEYKSTGPQAKVFAKTCSENGYSWTSCASHEFIEMAVDPLGSLAALDYSSGEFYSYEACDAVEDETYRIGGVEVSNFVTPNWFSADAVGPYDFLGQIPKPFQLKSGGYIETLDVSNLNGWKQITAQARQHFPKA